MAEIHPLRLHVLHRLPRERLVVVRLSEELRLELFDGARQGRLRDVQPLGGPPEVQFLGHATKY